MLHSHALAMQLAVQHHGKLWWRHITWVRMSVSVSELISKIKRRKYCGISYHVSILQLEELSACGPWSAQASCRILTPQSKAVCTEEQQTVLSYIYCRWPPLTSITTISSPGKIPKGRWTMQFEHSASFVPNLQQGALLNDTPLTYRRFYFVSLYATFAK